MKLPEELMGDNDKPNTHEYCCPIYITSMYGLMFENEESVLPQGEQLPNTRNGTLTFVEFNDQIYGITCRHVVKELDDQNSLKQRENIQKYGEEVKFVEEAQLHFFFPKGDFQIHINSKFHKVVGDEYIGKHPDVAIARISKGKLDQIGRKAIRFEKICQVATEQIANSYGIATGYPEKKRRYNIDSRNLGELGISNLVAIAPFNTITEDKIVLFAELDEEVDADNISGISGGPIFYMDEIDFGMVGIISQGRDINLSKSVPNESAFSGSTLWIDGVRISKDNLENWINQIPPKIEEIKDLSKHLYVPNGYTPK